MRIFKVGLPVLLLGILNCFLVEKMAGQSKPDKKPNILFFLVDDMGYMDCTVYGSKYYETPNIERLASSGMTFTNAYAANPLCSPTRASILSGKYPVRFHLTSAAGHLKSNPRAALLNKNSAPWQKMVAPGSRHQMPLAEYTVAEALKQNSYKTIFIGKWHLGRRPYYPENQGFDINIAGGYYPSPPSYFSPYHIETLKDGPSHEFLTDRLTEEALKALEDNKDSTFFMCLWQYAVHGPFQAKLKLIEKYKNKTDPRGKQNNPIMAAMVQSMDESLGKILSKLDELGIAENTIIIFASDNGGNVHSLVNGKSVTNNYPLRDGKGNIHEGGIRVSTIVVWPDKTVPGSKSTEVISSIDFYPTILEMTGTKGNPKQILDGESIVKVLKENGHLKRPAIFFDFPLYVPATNNYPSVAVRQGDWKLIRVYGEGKERKNKYELYNLKEDIGEKQNLAGKMPGLVKKLDKLIQRHIKKVGAIEPVQNPSYNPKTKSPMGRKDVFPKERLISY